MKKIFSYLILCVLSLSLFACNKGEKTPEENGTPVTENPTGDNATEEKPSEKPVVGNYSTEVYAYDGYFCRVTGGYVQNWTAHEESHIDACSIADIAKYSTEVADYLTKKNEELAKNGKPGIKALYMAEDYVLDNQPENPSNAPAIVKDLSKIGLTLDDVPENNRFEEGYLVSLNQGYAVKCVKVMYDELDDTYFADRWISDPKVAHTESLTPETLFIPKWVEKAAEGEEHLGEWDDNPMCIGGAGLYVVVMVEYNAVSTADTPGFGLALIKLADLVETPLED